MRVSLPRNRCSSVVLTAALLITPVAHAARDPFDLAYSVRFTSRAAIHLNNPRDQAMHRHTVDAEQTIKGDNWSAVLGGRAYAESTFGVNNRYNAPVRGAESQEFVIRDLYLQYKGNGIQLRLGNQQVVWGESFGFFFSDIVNPKDTREYGLGGDLTAQRITVPMANLVYFAGNYSFQFLYIPKPYFNMTPAQGSDFAFPLDRYFPAGTNVTITDDRTKPLSLSNGEFGLRATAMLSGWDMALFYLHYFDRRPSYRPTFAGTDINVRGVHEPISSLGITGTKDLQTWVARFELLYTRNRAVDAYYPDLINPAMSFYSALSDEMVGVLGFDYTQWRNWRLTFQFSHDTYFKNIPGALVPKNTTSLGVILGGTVFHNHEVNLITSYAVSDGSSLLQLSYMVPVSNRLEATLGAYLFEGGSNGIFGNFKGASRAFLQLRGYFGGT